MTILEWRCFGMTILRWRCLGMTILRWRCLGITILRWRCFGMTILRWRYPVLSDLRQRCLAKIDPGRGGFRGRRVLSVVLNGSVAVSSGLPGEKSKENYL